MVLPVLLVLGVALGEDTAGHHAEVLQHPVHLLRLPPTGLAAAADCLQLQRLVHLLYLNLSGVCCLSKAPPAT